MRGTLFKRLPWPQIVMISTNLNAFQIENCLKIIIFEKGQLQAYFKQNQDILQEFSGHILKYSQVPKSQIQIRKVKIWTYRLSLQSKRPYHPPTAIRGAVKIFLLDSARKDTGLIHYACHQINIKNQSVFFSAFLFILDHAVVLKATLLFYTSNSTAQIYNTKNPPSFIVYAALKYSQRIWLDGEMGYSPPPS